MELHLLTKDNRMAKPLKTASESGVGLTPLLGERVKFGSSTWEVSSVEEVNCEYDPDYHYLVNLIKRDRSGKPVNFATGIPNYCLG